MLLAFTSRLVTQESCIADPPALQLPVGRCEPEPTP
jgi:hypothetical protein